MNYALVTGGSKGIGKSLAAELGKMGYNLILVARSVDKLRENAEELRETCKVAVQTYAMDLTDPEADRLLYEWCYQNQYFIRILVNNAGYGIYGRFIELDLDEQLDMIRLSQILPVKMVHRFFPMLRQFRNSHILNVASTAGFQPVPYLAAYASSKSFLINFSRALRVEFRPYKINVSCLCPGPTNSDFFATAGLFKKGFTDNPNLMMHTNQVAEIAVSQMFKQQAVIVPGLSNRLGYYVSRLLPVSWFSGMVAGIFSPENSKKLTAKGKSIQTDN
jgi:short-subunit dehydrogenase